MALQFGDGNLPLSRMAAALERTCAKTGLLSPGRLVIRRLPSPAAGRLRFKITAEQPLSY